MTLSHATARARTARNDLVQPAAAIDLLALRTSRAGRPAERARRARLRLNPAHRDKRDFSHLKRIYD